MRGFLFIASLFGLLVLGGALFLMGQGLDTRGLITQRHEHVVDDSSVRVQVIGMTRFEVLAPGDRRFGSPRTGELQDMTLSLSAEAEFSSARGAGAVGIANVTDPDRDHLVYVKVDRGDVLTWNRSATYDDDAIWVNVARDGVLRLKMDARDLDCVGERICDRVSDGFYLNAFLLPELPDVLPETCGPNNTFEWANVDEGWTFLGTRVVDERSESRPVLRPLNGAICVVQPVTE